VLEKDVFGMSDKAVAELWGQLFASGDTRFSDCLETPPPTATATPSIFDQHLGKEGGKQHRTSFTPKQPSPHMLFLSLQLNDHPLPPPPVRRAHGALLASWCH
jgi:hypothetical protein